mmetsp:Transcript_7428/g.15942  ORF Transcript_7428/g.15942 Transcript_7428/m.15942 type:complete len:205 (-) Transcript_7428:5248-5862(-)
MHERKLANSSVSPLAFFCRAVLRSHRVPHTTPKLTRSTAPELELRLSVRLARQGVALRTGELGCVAINFHGVVDSGESDRWRLTADDWLACRNLGKSTIPQAARRKHTVARSRPVCSEPFFTLVSHNLSEREHIFEEHCMVHMLRTAALHRLALLLTVEFAGVRAPHRPPNRAIRLPVGGISGRASVLDRIGKRNLGAEGGNRS